MVKGAIGYRRSSYYANARFVCADQLISRYDRDLMILDIDITKIGDVAALVGVMKNYDFGYFSCGDIFPWLICRAAAVYVRREGSGRAFLQLVARYILSKIENEGFWGLDQAALYVVSRFLASTSDFRHVDLSEALGTSLEQYITLDMNESEKQQLRKAAHA